MTAKIIGEETVYSAWSTFRKVHIQLADGSRIVREVESHGVATAVFVFDPSLRAALFIKTVRAPVLMAGEPQVLEAPAGLIDDGETAEDSARREVREELGVALGELHRIGEFWPSPGVSCERVTLFLAEYSPADRVEPGGGLASENEQIEIVELPLAEVWARYEAGELTDMKTAMMLLELRRRRPSLFDLQA